MKKSETTKKEKCAIKGKNSQDSDHDAFYSTSSCLQERVLKKTAL